MISSSEKETIAFGKEFAKQLQSGDVVALHGSLGAGKTTFIKGVIEALGGVSEFAVQSPTFTYLNIYEETIPIYHFDLYRIEKEQNFIQKGFLDFFETEGICLIEWPGRIEALLPKNTTHVILHHLERGKREIVYNT